MTTTAAEARTDTQRREALKELARTWHELGSEVRQMRLRDLACPGLEGWDLDEAWDTLQGDLALLDGLNCEIWAPEAHWADVNSDLVGCDRTEAAREEMEQRVSGALDRLVRGKK